MRYLSWISRLVIGAVFVFSGFVKAVDPLGSAYKFSDYFTAFGLDFLSFTALPLAVGLSAFELVLGLVILLGFRRRVAYPVLLGFMAFFTLLTFILALFNPVSDCGCFGDALILTNWQTFLKNVVLMGFAGILWAGRRSTDGEGRPVTEWSLIPVLFLGAVFFSLWNYRHLPLLDFRPYDVGTHIPEEMEIPEGAPVDQYETTLVYRELSTGEEMEFTIETYPRDTARWEFVTSESKLVRKGYEPPIHDFAIMDPSGTDRVDEILSDPGFALLMISHDLDHAHLPSLQAAGEWSQLEWIAEDFSFYAVTASTTDLAAEVSQEAGLPYAFYSADGIMLKTMVRSNPGFLLIHQGTILGKWGYRDFPSLGELDPGTLEMIGNSKAPLDEETRLLMESGAYGEFSFGVMEFSDLLPSLVFEERTARLEKRAVYGFIVSILLLLFLSGRIARKRV